MTSFHKPNSRIVIVSQESGRTGRTKPLELGFVLPMLGAAATEQFSAKRRRGVMPVQNNGRRFNRAPGNPITRTARVIACRQVSRVSFGVSHFVSPRWSVAHSLQHTTGEFGNVRKAFGEIQNV